MIAVGGRAFESASGPRQAGSDSIVTGRGRRDDDAAAPRMAPFTS